MRKSDEYFRITVLVSSGTINEAELIIDGSRGALTEPELEECIGNVHFYKKEFQKAIPHFEAAMESAPDYDCARYHYLLGVQAEQADKLSDAFTRYQAAIEIEPTFVDSYIELGGLLCKIGEFEGALQCYSDAVEIDPTDLAIHHNLIQVLSQLAQNNPAAYLKPLQESRSAYDEAKKSSGEPDPRRLW